MQKYLKKISDPKIAGIFSKSGLGLVAILLITGCNSSEQNQTQSGITEATKNGATVTIEQQADGSYKILDEVPSAQTRVILREKDGSERILSQAEIDKIIADEAKKIDSGTSQLTNPTGGGLSLGETILASAAGAILGSWIGSKLFNNQNFQNQQRTTYKTPQAYERSQNSFNRSSAGTNAGRSGFYSPNNTSTQNRSTSGATSNYGG
ncbi:UPF0323 family lipoprotein [Helicobacter winghamensis]|uniref:UPF0323 family lipoprotein n=1 Tax=Helicobacter winghamensis TaxID=157268 RepID=UPI0001A283B4|nr:UPF0323 family lipoprotein [Helicobacter winghamensis]EEO26617.1 hypothetical protein HWAG_01409 [Helicobacter winghamensis ATCC BAA-430]PKT79223.1 hypothetical protein BCM34_06650 [Helicobacter winghamensis]PKT79427.1 hypothetical protein BCM35_06640 [Helicobacter winghamensis]QOQ98641.1 hypothetical protein A0Z60_03500 [Helicobacter winghamensis]